MRDVRAGRVPHAACGLATLGGALGRLQGVDLGSGGDLHLHMGSEVAAATGPLAGGAGVAGAEVFAFKLANAITAFALVNDGETTKPFTTTPSAVFTALSRAAITIPPCAEALSFQSEWGTIDQKTMVSSPPVQGNPARAAFPLPQGPRSGPGRQGRDGRAPAQATCSGRPRRRRTKRRISRTSAHRAG